jgi:hypothetical protein
LEIIEFAIQKRLPSMFNEKEWAVAGGLMSYGENFAAMYRRVAYFVSKAQSHPLLGRSISKVFVSSRRARAGCRGIVSSTGSRSGL